MTTLALLLAIAAPALAQTPAEHFSATKIKAERGDADAQQKLADMYQRGTGTPANMDKACEWTLKAAEQGLTNAQYNGALCALDGGDTQKALHLLKAAGDKSHIKALMALADLHMTGQYGMTVDLETAMGYYAQAADLGDADAMAEVAMHTFATGDKNQAKEMMTKAAERGSIHAAATLGKFYWLGHGVEKDTDLARTWLIVAAESGHTNAMEDLAIVLLKTKTDGNSLQIEDAKTIYMWLLRAQKAGHTLSSSGSRVLEYIATTLPEPDRKQVDNLVADEKVLKRL
jgi:TPR repeat protein